MQYACAILSPVVYPALHNFSGICSKRHAFLKKINITCVFRFSVQGFSWYIFLLEEELGEMWSKCILAFMSSIRYYCQILMKLEFFRQIFEKYWNIKFHENSSNKSRVATCGWCGRWTDGRTDRRTDRRTEEVTKLNSRSSQVFQRA